MSQSKTKEKKGFYMSDKTVLAIIIFVLVFGGLLAVATFTDLQVSRILTKYSLPEGQYFADDIFGRTFETVGCAPIYLMLGFAFHIIFWNIIYRFKDELWKYVLAAVCTGLGVTAYYIFFNDTARYILTIVDEDALSETFIKTSMLFLGCVFCFVATFAVKSLKEETVKNLLMFAIAVIVMAAFANGLVNLIKIPMARPRYRAMNTSSAKLIGAFANYKRWYQASPRLDKQSLLWYYGSTDACKSFPSGHTCSAGMTYALIMLIDALKIKSKKAKILLWVCPIVYTGIVALSRIMVGAHFFSDVLIGGTFAFVTMIIVREIFICRGSHLKKK